MSKPILFFSLAAILLLASCIHMSATADRTVSKAAIYTGQSPKGYIPPGSIIVLRAEEAVTADSRDRGKTYRAVVVNEIIDGNGKPLAPAGAPAQLGVMDFFEGGATTKGQLQLGLASITLDDTKHPVSGAGVSYAPLGVLVETSPAGNEVAAKGAGLRVPAQTVMTFQTDEPAYLQTP